MELPCGNLGSECLFLSMFKCVTITLRCNAQPAVWRCDDWCKLGDKVIVGGPVPELIWRVYTQWGTNLCDSNLVESLMSFNVYYVVVCTNAQNKELSKWPCSSLYPLSFCRTLWSRLLNASLLLNVLLPSGHSSVNAWCTDFVLNANTCTTYLYAKWVMPLSNSVGQAALLENMDRWYISGWDPSFKILDTFLNTYGVLCLYVDNFALLELSVLL